MPDTTERIHTLSIGCLSVVNVACMLLVLTVPPTRGAALNDTRPCQSAQESGCIVLHTIPKPWTETLPEAQALYSRRANTEDPLSNAIYPTVDLRRNASIVIDPPWVRRGGSAFMRCDYELDAPLYAVKWYRGQLEFYRYTPSENPSSKTFHHNDIKIDVSYSGCGTVPCAFRSPLKRNLSLHVICVNFNFAFPHMRDATHKHA